MLVHYVPSSSGGPADVGAGLPVDPRQSALDAGAEVQGLQHLGGSQGIWGHIRAVLADIGRIWSFGISGPLVWARLPSVRGSELWAPILKAVLSGFGTGGSYWGTIGSTLELG